MATTREVTVWALQDRSDWTPKKRKPFVVRWTVGGRPKSKAFAKVLDADIYRGRLLAAVNDRELFDPTTGEPVSWAPAPVVPGASEAVSFLAHALGLSVIRQRAQARIEPTLAVDDHGVEPGHVLPPFERSLEHRMVERSGEDRPGALLERVDPGELCDVVTDPRAVPAPVAGRLSDQHEVGGLVTGARVASRVGEGLYEQHRIAVNSLSALAHTLQGAAEYR